jgi:tetratricopeptide (TPR) repeat protein
MKIHFRILFTALVFSTSVWAQPIETLFNQKRYEEIIKRGAAPQNLSGKDLFQIAQSHLKLQNDSAAIQFAEMAEKKGYKGSDLYYAKAIAQNNLEMYGAAIETLNRGLALEPNRKTLLLEKAAAEYRAGRLDSAKKTYTTISRLFEGNQLANFMICQIQFEMAPNSTAARCFWDALRFFPDKNQFYQQSLENIAAIEFFSLLNFKGAEQTYLRLIKEFPGVAKYQEELTQMYHFSDQYEKGKMQMAALQKAWYDRKFSNETYRAGQVQIDGFADDILRAEVFWSPLKEPGSKSIYTFFIFSVNATRSLGKIEVFFSQEQLEITGYGFDTPEILPSAATYEEIKILVINQLAFQKEKFKP